MRVYLRVKFYLQIELLQPIKYVNSDLEGNEYISHSDVKNWTKKVSNANLKYNQPQLNVIDSITKLLNRLSSYHSTQFLIVKFRLLVHLKIWKSFIFIIEKKGTKEKWKKDTFGWPYAYGLKHFGFYNNTTYGTSNVNWQQRFLLLRQHWMKARVKKYRQI